MAKEIDQCLSSNELEYVEVKIKLPKPIVELIKNLSQLLRISEEDFYQWRILDCIRADVDNMEGYLDDQETIKLYGLKEIFESLDC